MHKKESPLLTFDVIIERSLVLHKVVQVEAVSSQKAKESVLKMAANQELDWLSDDVLFNYDKVELPENDVPRQVKKGELTQ